MELYKSQLWFRDRALQFIGSDPVDNGEEIYYQPPMTLSSLLIPGFGNGERDKAANIKNIEAEIVSDKKQDVKTFAIGKTRKLSEYDKLIGWNLKIARTEEEAKEFFKIFSQFFDEQGKAILKKVNSYKKSYESLQVSVEQIILSEIEKMKDMTRTPYAALLVANMNEAMRKIDVDITFTGDNSRIIEIIDDSLDFYSDKISKTSINDMFEIFEKGTNEGWPLNKVGDAIYNKTMIWTQSRSRMIAKTTTMNALNRGDYEAWSMSGVVPEKSWYAAPDEKTRLGHAEVDASSRAVPVPINDYYEVPLYQVTKGGIVLIQTDMMLHPHDWQNGSGGNVASCRCTQTAEGL